MRFHRVEAPTDADIARLVGAIARRLGRLLARRGLAIDADATDPLAAESPALAGLASAAVQGRLAGTLKCPPDSVKVGNVCVDLYEASVWQIDPIANHVAREEGAGRARRRSPI